MNTRAGRGQEQIVENQRPFARDRREQPALLQRRRPPSVERQAAADEQSQNGKDEHSARRIAGECCAPKSAPPSAPEGADQRQRECQDREQYGPDLERVALSITTAECNSAVPRATASATRSRPGPRTRSRPTELVIGPVRTHGDAERQAHPGASVHGRTQRAQAASMRPSISAAMANENEIEKPT